jgi:SWI/SNF-related matrix-associated actin-dependent regulator of chromatin subfamily A containing DEAD/H box 1
LNIARKIVSSSEEEDGGDGAKEKPKKTEKKKPTRICSSSDEGDENKRNKPKASEKNEENENGAKNKNKKNKKKMKKSMANGSGGSEADDNDDMDNEFQNLDDGSDSDSDAEMPETHKNAILALFNKATVDEIQSMINISAKRLETVLALRPFIGFADLRARLAQKSLLSVIESAKDIIYARQVVNELLSKCERISQRLDQQVQALNKLNEQEGDELGDCLLLKRQPTCLNEKLALKKYQLIGLNWLCLMYKENLNAILADEMGLGKTCQTIAFLAHLNETHPHKKMLHLIVVPPTTLDNWVRELSTWAPSLTYLVYQV